MVDDPSAFRTPLPPVSTWVPALVEDARRREAARSFGQVVAAVSAAGLSHRPRFADLLIASIAHANGLDLYTRNPKDLTGIEDPVTVRPL